MVREAKVSSLKKRSDKQLMKRAGNLKREEKKVNEKISGLKQKKKKIKKEYKKTKKIVVER